MPEKGRVSLNEKNINKIELSETDSQAKNDAG